MWRRLCMIWLLTVSSAIRVPVDNKEESTTVTVKPSDASPTQDAQVYYESDEENVDSYLVPPSPHKPAENKQDLLPTYLLPPSQDKQEDFYYVPNTSAQSDWYPIPQSQPQNNPSSLLSQVHQQEAIPIIMMDEHPNIQFNVENTRVGKSQKFEQQIAVPVPSTYLEPPLESAQNHFILPTPSGELQLPYDEQHHPAAPSQEVYELPILEVNQNFNPLLTKNTPVNFRLKPAEPTLSLLLTPPKPLLSNYKNPTKLYPKKYPGGFKPVPIPIAQFAEDSDVPKAKPAKPFNPGSSSESEYSPPADKEAYLYEKAKQKRKLRKHKAAKQQQLAEEEGSQNGEAPPLEQETSESHFRYPGRNVYPAPLRQAPPTAPPRPLSSGAPAKPPPAGDRTEFRMHGMKGPHSYQFGFDTGKGKNRQFRFEERDNDGHVRGHYGYVDKRGKLRVVNYDAHPQLGFHADAPTETEP